jgi:putative ABC transport system substrate-binding protein
MELRPVYVINADEIERAVSTFAQAPNGGLIQGNIQFSFVHRELIIGLAARHRLPAVYAYRSLLVSGGLVSYGTDATDQYRQAAGYVDRISTPKAGRPAGSADEIPSWSLRPPYLTIPETAADEVIH